MIGCGLLIRHFTVWGEVLTQSSTPEREASLRAIYDFGALAGQSVWIQSTGQSGSPFSDLYANMMPLWRDVQYVPMRTAVAGHAMVLELRPR